MLSVTLNAAFFNHLLRAAFRDSVTSGRAEPASPIVSCRSRNTSVSILAFFVFSDGNVKAQSNPHDKLISRGETASLQTLAGRVAVLGIVAAKQLGSGGVSPRA